MEEIIPLDSTRVEGYVLKSQTLGISITFDCIYVVYWVDGTKSVIGITHGCAHFLILGCETAEIDDDGIETIKRDSRKSKILTIVVILALIAFFYWLSTFGK